MRERRGSVVETCPSQAHATRQSRSSHLLSITLVLFHAAAACVHVELKDAPFSHDGGRGPGYFQGCEEEVVFDFGRPLDASGGRACESCGGGVESKGQVAEGHGGGEAWPLQVEGRVWAQKRPKGGHGEEQRRPVRTKEEGCTWERPRAKRVRSTDWHAVAVCDGKVTPWWPQMQLRLYQARSAAEVALELSLGSRGMVRGRLVVQLRLADDCGIGRPLLLDEWRSLLGMHCACATRSPAAGEV